MLGADNTELEFTEDGINMMAEYAHHVNEETENIGARRLHTILERILEDISFDTPYEEAKKILIDRDFVSEKLGKVVTDVDMSRYIL